MNPPDTSNPFILPSGGAAPPPPLENLVVIG